MPHNKIEHVTVIIIKDECLIPVGAAVRSANWHSFTNGQSKQLTSHIVGLVWEHGLCRLHSTRLNMYISVYCQLVGNMRCAYKCVLCTYSTATLQVGLLSRGGGGGRGGGLCLNEDAAGHYPPPLTPTLPARHLKKSILNVSLRHPTSPRLLIMKMIC